MTPLKKGLAILTIVGGVFVAAEQNRTGKDHDYLLGLAGGIAAIAAVRYLKGEQKEERFKPYELDGRNIILDPSQYSVEPIEQKGDRSLLEP